jgi:acetyl esterase/lipase
MTEFPALVPTLAGALGAIVTAPDGTPRAAAVILHGANSTRAGTNQVWATVARSLGEVGVVTMRVDYPGLGESHAADGRQAPEAVAEALAWFRERTANLELLVVGVCAGVLPAAELALRDTNVRAVAVMTPPLFPEVDVVAPPRASSRRRLAYRARRLPKRVYYRARYGVRHQRLSVNAGAYPGATDLMRDLTRRTMVWVLTGDGDTMAPMVRSLAPELTASGNCRVEFVDGSLYSYPTPDSQQLQHDRVLAWARSSLGQELSA